MGEFHLKPMTFAALADPVDMARAHAAVEAAWQDLKARSLPASDSERALLSDIVASHVVRAANDHDLVRRSVAGFLASRRGAAFVPRLETTDMLGAS